MTRVRPFARDDEQSVIELWSVCGLLRPWNDPLKDIERKLAVRPDWFLVATLHESIVGSVMAGYEGHRGWINFLAVAPAHRRRGIGRMLMEEAERRLLAEGCPKVNLQVRTGNVRAIAFYEELGYAPDDVVSLGKRLIEDWPGD
jgi:ribosomal protein S18 acetylase RimI-like enzyme